MNVKRPTGKTGGNAGPRPARATGKTGASAGPSGSCTGSVESAEAAQAARSRIASGPWWERFPRRLERELRALDEAKIPYKRDDGALRNGILKLHLTMTDGSSPLPLEVVFPDLYPYFRFEVYARTLRLPYHQNPFDRNLCLIGRRTFYWNPEDTVAGLLTDQLPKVLWTARSNDPSEVAGIEQEQAEPFSNYYICGSNMIMVRSDWSLGSEQKGGTFDVGTLIARPDSGPIGLRGAILELRDAGGNVLHTAEPSFQKVFRGQRLSGGWVRTDAPIRESNPKDFADELFRREPRLRHTRSTPVGNGLLRVFGVLFPEETSRRLHGEGWVFVCEHGPVRSVSSNQRQGETKRRRRERKKRR